MLNIFQSYWPAILILFGIGYLIYGVIEDEIAIGIILLVIFSGLGVTFFIYSPSEVWTWLSGYELIQFLFSGKWYEITLKVAGALGAIGMVIRTIVISFQG